MQQFWIFKLLNSWLASIHGSKKHCSVSPVVSSLILLNEISSTIRSADWNIIWLPSEPISCFSTAWLWTALTRTCTFWSIWKIAIRRRCWWRRWCGSWSCSCRCRTISCRCCRRSISWSWCCTRKRISFQSCSSKWSINRSLRSFGIKRQRCKEIQWKRMFESSQ